MHEPVEERETPWRASALAGVALLAFLATAVLAQSILDQIFTSVGLHSVDTTSRPLWAWLLLLVAGDAGIIPIVWYLRTRIEHQPLASLGLGGNPVLGWLLGVSLGAVLMAIVFTIELGAGWLSARPAGLDGRDIGRWLELALAFLVTGFAEELLFRGYILQTLQRALGPAGAALLSSVVFGLLHAGNPGATVTSTCDVMLAGLLFCLAYYASGSLWLPIGLHFAWNFWEGVVFNFPVSGLNLPGILITTVHGPALWTGGQFGPESGLAGVAAIIAGFAIVGVFGRKRLAHFSWERAAK